MKFVKIGVDREACGMTRTSEITDVNGDAEGIGNPTVVRRDHITTEVKVDLLTIAVKKDALSKIETTDDIVIAVVETNMTVETTRPDRGTPKNKEVLFVDKASCCTIERL